MHGYRIVAGHRTCVWAPEFSEPPAWARDADLMFAGTGASPDATARAARHLGVRRLVFARLPTTAYGASERGVPLPFGEWGAEGMTYRL